MIERPTSLVAVPSKPQLTPKNLLAIAKMSEDERRHLS